MNKYSLYLLLSLISLSSSNIYAYWQDANGDGYKEVRCTYWAWQKAHDVCGVDLPNFGNAGNWYDSARAYGYSVGSEPKANSIIVYTDSGWGHVAFVTSLNGNDVCVEEGGRIDLARSGGNGIGTACHPGNVGYNRWADQYIKGYIYLPGCSADGGRDPIGVVDEVTGGAGTVHVRGWCFDQDDVNVQIQVHVYIGGPAGSGYGVPFVANANRPDVNNVYGCGNDHGFDLNISVPDDRKGSQDVYVYAINIKGGNNVMIGSKNAYIS